MRWAIETTSGPAVEPMTTAEAKTHLQENLATWDAYIDTLILTARILIEEELGRSLITQTKVMYLDSFPIAQTIMLPQSPAQSVTSVSYVDTDGASQIWASSKYALDAKSRPARLYLAYNESYPTTRTIENAVTITYVAGYGTASTDIPAPIIHAMKLMITDWYDNREASCGNQQYELPMGAKRLLSPYKMYYRGPIV